MLTDKGTRHDSIVQSLVGRGHLRVARDAGTASRTAPQRYCGSFSADDATGTEMHGSSRELHAWLSVVASDCRRALRDMRRRLHVLLQFRPDCNNATPRSSNRDCRRLQLRILRPARATQPLLNACVDRAVRRTAPLAKAPSACDTDCCAPPICDSAAGVSALPPASWLAACCACPAAPVRPSPTRATTGRSAPAGSLRHGPAAIARRRLRGACCCPPPSSDAPIDCRSSCACARAACENAERDACRGQVPARRANLLHVLSSCPNG